MRKSLKALCSLIIVLCLSFSFTSLAYAAENNASNNASEVSLRAPICGMCGIGVLISTTTTTGPYFYSSHVCTQRPDCLVIVYQYNHIQDTHCTNCSFGYTTISSTYSETHSISH